MEPDSDGDAVELEVWIDASPEVVFPFLTDPARLARWIGVAATLEPRPGGVFRVDMNGRDVARGEYLEVLPHRRVVFSWGWEGAGHGIEPGTTIVTIELEPKHGGTQLRLRHSGLSGENRIKHERGWSHYAARLRIAAQGGDPGPDPLATTEASHG